MSNQEIELHIKNLYDSVNALAGKTYKRESSAESDISRLNSELAQACQESTVGDTWTEKERYTKDRYVLDEGHIFRCLISNYGVKPSTEEEPHYWLHTNVVKELNYLNDKISKQ